MSQSLATTSVNSTFKAYNCNVSQQRRLTILLLINTTMITALIAVGLFSHSLSVLAAGGDFIADSLAIVLGLFAIYRRDKHSDERATTHVALINAVMLFVITLFVLVEAVHRLLTNNPEIHALPVFIVALLSAIGMGAGVSILGRGAGKEDLHMRSVFLDTVSDGLSAVCVAIVGVIIFATHKYYWLDSVAAIFISLVIAFGAIRLMRDVIKSLKSGQPISFNDD